MITWLVLVAGLKLPPPQLEITLKVAGEGKPECTSYQPDGAIGPCLPAFELEAGGQVNGRSIGLRIAFTRAATEKL